MTCNAKPQPVSVGAAVICLCIFSWWPFHPGCDALACFYQEPAEPGHTAVGDDAEAAAADLYVPWIWKCGILLPLPGQLLRSQ